MASLYPKEVCGRFKDFMALVFDLLQGDDVTFMVLAAETLAVIGGTLEGKMALEKQGLSHLKLNPRMIDRFF